MTMGTRSTLLNNSPSLIQPTLRPSTSPISNTPPLYWIYVDREYLFRGMELQVHQDEVNLSFLSDYHPLPMPSWLRRGGGPSQHPSNQKSHCVTIDVTVSAASNTKFSHASLGRSKVLSCRKCSLLCVWGWSYIACGRWRNGLLQIVVCSDLKGNLLWKLIGAIWF